MNILGIDPGKSGAFAFLDTDECRIRIEDMPLDEFFLGKKKQVISPFEVADIVTSCDADTVHAYVEDVYSSPQMGVVSAFNFGYSKGLILAALATHGVPYTPVKPIQWQKAMRCPADPKAAVMRATQLFPRIAHLFKGPRGGVRDGRAEAAMIALYGAFEMGCTPKSVVLERE